MKRSILWIMVALFATVVAVSAQAQSPAQSQSLGDLARKQRQKKYENQVATKVYTNDNLPPDNSMKDGSSDDAKPADSAGSSKSDDSASEDSADKDKSADGSKKPAPGSVEEFKKNAAEWQKKVEEQKKNVAALQQQIESMQQQYRLRASAYYTDAGLRLRDGGAKWAEDEVSFRKTIDDKQKELDAAKQKLVDLQDQGHKAGAPNSALE